MLGAFRYSRNETLLHTDTSVLPRAPRRPGVVELPHAGLLAPTDAPVLVSYDMNRLQRLDRARRYVVTLNGDRPRRPGRGARTDGLRAPGLHARSRWPRSAGCPRSTTARVAFAGAYHGWGFHEDGCASGVRAAAALGVGVVTPRDRSAVHALPALYDVEVRHVRTRRWTARFRHRVYLWLVDLDALPRAAALAAAVRPVRGARPPRRPGPARSGRTSTPASPATASTCDGGRVLMLANARVLGYVFNPLTVYWCHRPDGALACVVAEVHNTYGERHCYLLRPDADGPGAHAARSSTSRRSSTVDGEYRMRAARARRAAGGRR